MSRKLKIAFMKICKKTKVVKNAPKKLIFAIISDRGEVEVQLSGIKPKPKILVMDQSASGVVMPSKMAVA